MSNAEFIVMVHHQLRQHGVEKAQGEIAWRLFDTFKRLKRKAVALGHELDLPEVELELLPMLALLADVGEDEELGTGYIRGAIEGRLEEGD
jgi:hypothetical protein